VDRSTTNKKQLQRKHYASKSEPIAKSAEKTSTKTKAKRIKKREDL